MNKRILVIVPDKSAVGYFRMLMPMAYLRDTTDYEVVMCHAENIDYSSAEVTHFDMIFFHANLLAVEPFRKNIKRIKLAGCKLVMDIDDYWDLPISNPYFKEHTVHQYIGGVFKYLSCITTTTKLFKQELDKYHKNVVVLPNVINTNIPQFKMIPTEFDRLRIGVICGASHQADIELLSGLVSGLGEYNKYIQWSVSGFDISASNHPEMSVWNTFEQIFTNDYKTLTDDYREYLLRYSKDDYPDVESMPYRRYWAKDITTYASMYNNIDILLAPLVNNKFNCMKSELKIVETGTFGKVFIGSSVGIYKEVINNGENGLLIRPSEGISGWIKAIKNIIDNRELYYYMQSNLYNTVHNKYDIARWNVKRVNFINKILSDEKRRTHKHIE